MWRNCDREFSGGGVIIGWVWPYLGFLPEQV